MPADGVEHLSHDAILRYEEIERIANFALQWGVNKFRVTGGEPLVRKGVVNLVEMLARMDGLEDLGLTTNGTLLAKYARDLHNAGLARINISLDTLKDGRFNQIARRGNLLDVLRGIDAAEKVGFDPIKINVVVIKGINSDEIEDFAMMSLDRPLHIRFIELMPIGSRTILGKDKFMPVSQIRERLLGLNSLVPTEVSGAGPAKYYRFGGGKGTVGFISPISEPFCKSCNRIRLSADGKLRPCLFADSGVDIMAPLRSGAGHKEVRKLFEEVIVSRPEEHDLSIQGQDMFRIGG
jgi:cyclic pyranopterin phosphate synthase